MTSLNELIAHVRRLATSLYCAVTHTFDLRDVHIYGGLLMAGYGIAMISPAAAWSLCGISLFWIGVRR